MKISSSPRHYQHLLLDFWISDYPSGSEGVSWCSFDFHFPDDLGCKVYLHILISHFSLLWRNVYSGRLSILKVELLCLFIIEF